MARERTKKPNMLGTFIIAAIGYIVLGVFMVIHPDITASSTAMRINSTNVHLLLLKTLITGLMYQYVCHRSRTSAYRAFHKRGWAGRTPVG